MFYCESARTPLWVLLIVVNQLNDPRIVTEIHPACALSLGYFTITTHIHSHIYTHMQAKHTHVV